MRCTTNRSKEEEVGMERESVAESERGRGGGMEGWREERRRKMLVCLNPRAASLNHGSLSLCR